MNELNTYFRTLLNNSGITYQGSVIPVHFQFDQVSGNSAYIVGSIFTTQPQQLEVGFTAKQEIQGYYNVAVYLPATDMGLDWAVNNISDQISIAFPRGSAVLECGKIEITDIETITPTRQDGQVLAVMRVNYRAVI